jgi:hypothetical protein
MEKLKNAKNAQIRAIHKARRQVGFEAGLRKA